MTGVPPGDPFGNLLDYVAPHMGSRAGFLAVAHSAHDVPGPDLVGAVVLIILAGLYGLVRGPRSGHRVVAVVAIFAAIALLVHWSHGGAAA
jgi:hypothetical protein